MEYITVSFDVVLQCLSGSRLQGGRKSMKFHYYPDTDSLYIVLSEKVSADSREVAPGVVLDFDTNGRLVGIDIDRASQIVDLSRLEAESLPMGSLSLTSK
jgi:uncharacterized protein YuzE